MGNTSSDWEGVYLDNSAAALSADVDCLPLSAINTIYAAGTSSDYDDDSTFLGYVTYDATSPRITTWRETLTTDQDDDAGDVDRIEYGRELKISFETDTLVRTTFTITLTSAMPGMIVTGAALLASLLFM